MAKVHIGLVAESRELENEIKQATESWGGCYIHHSKNVLELAQKSSFDKAQVIVLDLPAKGEGSELNSLITFIRSKKDLQKLPIVLLTATTPFEVPFLLLDSNLRCFPKAAGLFLPMLSIEPLLKDQSKAGTLTKEWIQSEFLSSLSNQVGLDTIFEAREPAVKEQRSAFFSQKSEEVRTHLGWFKFTARLLEQDLDGLSKLFAGMSRDAIEELTDVLMGRVIEDFKTKAVNDLSTRGAVYLPPTDRLNPQERKWVLTQVKNHGVFYSSPECQVLLEISQYI